MKLKVFKWSIRVYDLIVFLFLVGYFSHKPFRDLFDSSPYLVKSAVWLGVVLFFYYSIKSWFVVIKSAMVSVITKEESSLEESNKCDFVVGDYVKEEKDEVED